MNNLDIIRAWKDKSYRNSLSADQLAQLPENPAGAIELTNDELGNVDGGTTPTITIGLSMLASGLLSYYLGTNGNATNCCPPPPPPPTGY
jgi:mersacidin/lichenicidin family type 2 lantibiotic